MDIKIYCLKCKIKTDTNAITKTKTKNNRNLIRGIVQFVEIINRFLCRVNIKNRQRSTQLL